MKRNITMHQFLGKRQGLTLVNSSAYGVHWRSRRGTYREVFCNKKFLDNSRRTDLLNQTAKPVFDVLRQSAADCRESFLWQHMLSRLRKSTSNDRLELLQQLEGLNLHRRYPLQQLFPARLEASLKVQKSNLVVDLKSRNHPLFSKRTNGYRFSVQLIYYHEGKNRCSHETCVSEWIAAKEAPFVSLLFPKRKALCCLVGVRIQARTDLEIVQSFWGNRMGVVKVVEL